MSLPTSSLPGFPASDDNDLQTLHLAYRGHACSGLSLPRHLSPLPPHFLLLTPLQPHWYFSSGKHQALFWPRSLAFTLHSERYILLPEPIPKTAAISSFQSQRKCHLLCLTVPVAFSSHHPSLPYCPTYPLQFYILHLFSKTILFVYLLFISLSPTKMHVLWESGQGHSLKVTAISPVSRTEPGIQRTLNDYLLSDA